MKILRNSFIFLSKLKINCNLSSHAKISHFPRKRYVLFKTLSSVNLITHRNSSVANLCETTYQSIKNGKQFIEKENLFAHKIMENLSQYGKTLIKHPSSSSDICFSESAHTSTIVDKFVEVTLHNLQEGLTLENSKFTDLINRLCRDLSELSDGNIKTVLHYLCMWPLASSTHAQNFKTLWNMLDRECVKRMNRWDVSQKLLIADYWFHLKLSRITQYNSALIFNLIQNVDSLSSHQVVQLMFYINTQRKVSDLCLPSLENRLQSIVEFLTPEELGIVCLGYFKTQRKISNVNLVEAVIKKFMSNIEHLNNISTVAILKFLRISMNPSLTHLYILILHKGVSCIDKLDLVASVHLVLLALECNVYQPVLLGCVAEKFVNDMPSVRIKDCAKFLMCSSIYNHFEEKFHDLFFEELKKESRQAEINSIPLHLLHSLLSYAYMGYYNYDFLAKVFEKEYYNKAILASPELRHTYAELDFCTEIECPDYTGPRLNPLDRTVLQYRRGNLPSKSKFQNMQTRLLSDVYKSLVDVTGSDKNVHIRHILPHIYSPDIIVRLSGNMDKPLSELCNQFSPNHILIPPAGEQWAAIIICSTYSFAYKSSRLTGIISMKIRQLKRIGYRVTYIPYFNLSRDLSVRNAFIKEKLNQLKDE